MSVRSSPRDLHGHQPSIDGLRGIAVLLVIGSHLVLLLGYQQPTPWSAANRMLRGGFLGVDIFFVLSGFLITSLILREVSEHGRFTLRAFYARRALRLLPALYVLLVVVFVVSIAVGFPLDAQWSVTWPAVLYIINWYYALEAFGAAGEIFQTNLGHLWSLAIEEQFYLVWPFLMYVASRRRSLMRWMPVVSVLLVIAVIAQRVRLLDQGVGTVFIFVRTDARLDSILLGTLLAFGYRHLDLHPRLCRFGAYVSLVVIAGFMNVAPTNSLLFRGGFTVIAIAAAFVILGSLDESWRPTAVLGSRVLTSTGRVSYGLYLWHFPIFDFMASHATIETQSVRVVTALAVTGAVTVVSWRLIEAPCLRIKRRRFSGGAPAAGAIA
ncbi:MAG: acyltransferase family protein [Ilumatobacteraceae bacterium]